MNLFYVGLIIFLVSITLVEMLKYSFKNMKSVHRAKIRNRLRKYTHLKYDPEGVNIIRTRVLSEVPLLNRILLAIPMVRRLDQLVIQANPKYPLGFYILLSAVLGVFGFLVVNVWLIDRKTALVAGLIFSLLPLIRLKKLKEDRIGKFKAQLPEGLELIARALKAGHSFNSGLKLVAEEFSDPLGPEFEETLDEINFGISVADALKNLTRRIECPEISYFAVAVILQRESGGNLAELIENLAQLIREKFKFQGKIRALSAEGKISAMILVVLPFLIALYIQVVNPEYLGILFTEKLGRVLLYASGILMAAGILVMKRIIIIKL